MKNSFSTAEVDDICLACGLCCDGTLFSHVTLQDGDDSDALATLELEHVDEAYGFVQPCQALDSCGSCQVYDDRPVMCAKFECDLLKRAKEKHTSKTDALDIIHQVGLLKDKLKTELLSVGCPEQYLISFREQVVYIDSELYQEVESSKYKQLYTDYFALKSYLKRYFQGDEKINRVILD